MKTEKVKMEGEPKEVKEIDYFKNILGELQLNVDNIKEEPILEIEEEPVPVINDETLNDLLNEINNEFED